MAGYFRPAREPHRSDTFLMYPESDHLPAGAGEHRFPFPPPPILTSGFDICRSMCAVIRQRDRDLPCLGLSFAGLTAAGENELCCWILPPEHLIQASVHSRLFIASAGRPELPLRK